MTLRILQYQKVKWQSNCPAATTRELSEGLIQRATGAAEALRDRDKMEIGYFDIELVRGVEIIDHVIGCL